MSNDFGNYLRELRGNKSLRRVAQKSGISHAYIRDLELNRNRSTNAPIKPNPDTLRKLSIAYDVPYADLLEKSGVLSTDNYIGPEYTIHDLEELFKYRLRLGGETLTEEEKDRAMKMLKILFNKKH